MSSSDIKDALNQIDHKLKLILEDSFLSKLDLMFSVLTSLTIFGVSLMLSNISMMGLLSSFLTSILVLLFYTLIGEFWAILKDDAVGRFCFWMSLAFSIGTLGLYALVYAVTLSALLTFFFFLSGLAPIIYMIVIVFYVDTLFTKYARRLRSRELPDSVWAFIWKPIAIGYLIFGASLAVGLLISLRMYP